MSVISGLGGGASQAAWAENRAGSSGQNRRAQEMFARADVDGSGSVDASELQTVLDKFSQRSGSKLGSAESQFSSMDSDGDGSLNSSELDSGLRSLLPPPSSTLEFAARQQQGGGHGGPGGAGGRPPPPPPAGGGESDAQQSLSAADQALDANGDGVLSMQERLGGQLKDLLQQVISASDSDGDGALSSSETESLRSQFSSALDQALSGTASSSSSSSSDSSGASGSGSASSALDQLASLLLRRYGGVAEGGWQSRASLSLSA